MPKWTDARIEDFFQIPQLAVPKIEKVRKGCPPELRNGSTRNLNPSREIQGFIRFDNRIVVERRDGWYCRRNKNDGCHLELLGNARCRLAKVVTYNRTGRTFDAGTVVFHGEEIPLVSRRKRNSRKARSGWLREFLLQQGKGLLNYNQHWGPNAISVAAQFHPPEIIEGLDVGAGTRKLVRSGYLVGASVCTACASRPRTEMNRCCPPRT